jgi:hypothetical protein
LDGACSDGCRAEAAVFHGRRPPRRSPVLFASVLFRNVGRGWLTGRVRSVGWARSGGGCRRLGIGLGWRSRFGRRSRSTSRDRFLERVIVRDGRGAEAAEFGSWPGVGLFLP